MKRKKKVVEECISIDANELARQGYFKDGASGKLSGFIHWQRMMKDNMIAGVRIEIKPRDIPATTGDFVFMTEHSDSRISNKRTIKVVSIRQKNSANLLMYRFICPKCKRKVQNLFYPPSDKPRDDYRYAKRLHIYCDAIFQFDFLCKKCHRLNYQSQGVKKSTLEKLGSDKK